MKGFKLSPLNLPPVRKVKVKRTHYRVLLGLFSMIVFAAHHYWPDYEVHLALALNALFVIDPTA